MTSPSQDPPQNPPPGIGPARLESAPGQPAVPKKKRTGLIIGVVAAVAVLLVGAGVMIAVLMNSVPDTARSAGDTFMSALKDQNMNAIRSVSCKEKLDKLSGTGNGGAKLPDWFKLTEFDYTFLSDRTTDNAAHKLTYKAEIQTTINGNPQSTTTTFRLTVIKEDGDWKVCQLDAE